MDKTDGAKITTNTAKYGENVCYTKPRKDRKITWIRSRRKKYWDIEMKINSNRKNNIFFCHFHKLFKVSKAFKSGGEEFKTDFFSLNATVLSSLAFCHRKLGPLEVKT